MGVRIIACSAPEKLSVPDDPQQYQAALIAAGRLGFSSVFRVFNYEAFEARCTLPKGWYATEELASFDVSYSFYNHLRRYLATLVGVDLKAFWNDPTIYHGPLWELLNFADNEGVLGYEVCAHVTADLLDLQAGHPGWQAPEWHPHLQSLLNIFFAAASHGGVVVFR